MSVNPPANVVACRASLHMAGTFTFSCPVKRISSAESAQVFVDEAGHGERSASRVEDLIIRISALPDFYDIYTSPIRASLELVPQLMDLTLLLPPTTPAVLLRDVNFPALQFFKTNLPHAALSTFLTHHQSLSVLVLGPCGSTRRCPLLEVDLSRVVELECDTECVHSLVHHDLFHLKIGNSLDGPSVGFVLCTSPVCASGLHSLAIDFFPGDVDVLHDVSSFAPFLRKLKLVEQRTGSRRGQSRCRAFNDALTWARTLRKLRNLEELSLQTFVKLVQCVGDYHLERSLVMGWIYGVRSRGMRRLPSSAKAHPTLYHIRIWYGAEGRDAALSKWYKDGAEWRRLGLPIVGQDLDDVDF